MTVRASWGAGWRSWGGAGAVLIVAGWAVFPAAAQEAETTVSVNVWKPEKTEPTEERIKSLKVAPGFRIEPFAKEMGGARWMAVGPDGSVWLTRRPEADLVRIRDTDGDGRADGHDIVFTREGLHGLAIKDGKMYLATTKEVLVANITPDGGIDTPRVIIDDLPDGGQHPSRTIAVGPDGGVYITVGSPCNACPSSNPEYATILRADADGQKREVFASGLRNVLGFGWHPRSGQMWAMDQGIDDLGDDESKEELNLVEKGNNYGWPYVYENGTFNPTPPMPPGVTKEQLIERNTNPALTYTAHASPLAMVFVGETTGAGPQPDRQAWPVEWRDDALVAFRGSWNRKPPSGYEVSRVVFENGQPVRFEPFITGFLVEDGKQHFGRPVGLAWAHDGALLISDDTCGMIYRVSREGGAGGTVTPRPERRTDTPATTNP